MRFKRRSCFINTTRMAATTRCPSCGERCDAASSLKLDKPGPKMPKPGDYAMCGYCGSFNVYTPKLRLRRATDEELREAQANPRLAEHLELAAKAAMMFRKKNDWTVKQ